MNVTTQPLGPLVLRTLLWLPPCFWAWHATAPWHASVAGGAARLMLGALKPGLVDGIERTGRELTFVTSLEQYSAAGQAGSILVTVNPLVYTYGMALFAALMLGSRARWWLVPAGLVLLLPFQAWGIAFEVLAQLGISQGEALSQRAGLSGWRAEAIALAYQVGALILPPLAPVACWAALARPIQFPRGEVPAAA